MKKKTILFLFILLMLILIGVLSYTALLSETNSDNPTPELTKVFSKSETYKSEDKRTNTHLKLDYKDSTYTYQEKYIMKPGDDVGYETESKGRFKMDKDTLIFYSDMPDNSQLDYDTHRLTPEEISKNKFSYIYPIDEKVNQNQVKIYFDNIADIENYKAFTLINNQLKSLRIIERKELKESKLVTTKDGNFFLFHYLIIEKPSNNQLLITGLRSESFLFDFNKIPYSSFHFFTRVYWSFADFTGLKFQKTDETLKRIKDVDDKRYEFSQALNSNFIKQ